MFLKVFVLLCCCQNDLNSDRLAVRLSDLDRDRLVVKLWRCSQIYTFWDVYLSIVPIFLEWGQWGLPVSDPPRTCRFSDPTKKSGARPGLAHCKQIMNTSKLTHSIVFLVKCRVVFVFSHCSRVSSLIEHVQIFVTVGQNHMRPSRTSILALAVVVVVDRFFFFYVPSCPQCQVSKP